MSLLIWRRLNSTSAATSAAAAAATSNYFKIFPKTFSSSNIQFNVDLKKLRNEYRALQKEHHPDQNQNQNQNLQEGSSQLLNKAYNTLKSPLTRARHILKLNGINLDEDAVSKEYGTKDKSILFELLDIYEELETYSADNEFDEQRAINQKRINDSIAKLQQEFDQHNYEAAAIETVKLKYWVNIDDAIKNRVPGTPISLIH